MSQHHRHHPSRDNSRWDRERGRSRSPSRHRSLNRQRSPNRHRDHADHRHRQHHHDHNNQYRHHRDRDDPSSPQDYHYQRSRHYEEDDDWGRRYDDHRSQRSHREASLPPEHPGEPNINVVLRHLPDRYQEPEIHKCLEDMGGDVDEVNLIRDRDTGESRKFAFVRFVSVGHATQFVEKHYPHFYMGRHRVRIDYSHNDNTKDDKSEWRCVRCGKYNDESRRNCIECKKPFGGGGGAYTRMKESETLKISDGVRDVSYVPNSLLLLRNLNTLSSEESVYRAVSTFPGMRRVLLIRDKLTRMSCEFAFVEFDSPHRTGAYRRDASGGSEPGNRLVRQSG
ncbi:hypothetical protein BCR43DRAFT_209732 [Syncephalastrum racemosum]|uniref:RRM domain-containing protein n=1 Tax=Syncephalastrum racemosum TaxID=13706 RepID=A0A1X2HJU4_SYNRA|nr:hypothetical protein BCR43DRAFT_209732 [Syncephalastrum racemosum]